MGDDRMRFAERIKSEMKRKAAGLGHSMSRYRRGGDAAFPFRSECGTCGGHIELGFASQGARSFAPRGRAPFERCPGARGGNKRRVTT